MARALRLKVDCGFALQYAVHVAPEFRAVVNHGDVVPAIQAMEKLTIEKDYICGWSVYERIEAPVLADDSDFKKEAGVCIGPGAGVLFGEVKPPLFRSTSQFGAKDGFERKDLGSSKRMFTNEERIVNSVELDRIPQGRMNHVRMTKDRRWDAANPVDTIEGPDLAPVFGWSLCNDRRRDQEASQNGAGRFEVSQHRVSILPHPIWLWTHHSRVTRHPEVTPTDARR